MIRVATSPKPWKAIKIIMVLKKVNKSGCGFQSINFKSRKDLKLT